MRPFEDIRANINICVPLQRRRRFSRAKMHLVRTKLDDFNFAWQRSYYDHVISDEEKSQEICDYIVNNPLAWADDRNNIGNDIKR